jgi:hypothetical protein
MSTLSEHAGNGSLTETSPYLEVTKEQIYGVLQNFDVLTSRFDTFIFRHIYVYLIGLLLLGELFIIPPIISDLRAGTALLVLKVSALPMIPIISALWLFNRWRWSTQKTLRDLFEKKRIYLPNGDASTTYLRFLENYRNALGSPLRHFLSSFPVIVVGSLGAYGIVLIVSVEHLHIVAMMLFVLGGLLIALSNLGGWYCMGLGTWTVYVSGWYVRKLVRAFEFRIQPFHPDKCGGLKLLGNFCFGLVTPILISSALAIGYIFLNFISQRISESSIDTFYLILYVGIPFLFILLYGFPVIVFAFILPMRAIHAKMVSVGETAEDTYITRIGALWEEIHVLLDTNKIEEAKAVREKKALLETLHTPYPTWPFSIRSKIFSTVLGASSSFLIGMVTAALPIVLPLIFHNR